MSSRRHAPSAFKATRIKQTCSQEETRWFHELIIHARLKAHTGQAKGLPKTWQKVVETILVISAVPGISDGPDSRVSQTLVPFIVELLCHGYAIVSPREQPEYERSVVEAVNAGVKLLSA